MCRLTLVLVLVGVLLAPALCMARQGITASPAARSCPRTVGRKVPNRASASASKMLMDGLGAWVAFDAIDLVESLLTQPLLIIAGSEAGSLWHSQELFAKAPGPKELFIVEGAAHMDLYDGPGVGTAVSKLSPFFERNLRPARAAEGRRVIAHPLRD